MYQLSTQQSKSELKHRKSKKILIIEDDPDIAELIHLHLGSEYDRLVIANNGTNGFELACKQEWDLIILDLRLPGKDGLAVCQDLRAQQQYVPILMLTSKSSELDRVIGLEAGADDYLTKPFSIMELSARIKAIFRRAELLSKPASNESLLISKKYSLELDTCQYRVRKDGCLIDLTTKEFDLLCYFLQNPNQVFSRAHLLNKVWGYGYQGYEHTVNSHINRLRTKIESDPTQPEIITTVWGVGYKLEEE